MLWRRSYDTPPPPIEPGSEYSQDADPRYADEASAPLTECLKDVVARMVPYWESTISQELHAGKTVLVAAHGNSLRALVKHLDGISDEDIAELNIPTGIPLRYDLDENLKPIKPAAVPRPGGRSGRCRRGGEPGRNANVAAVERAAKHLAALPVTLRRSRCRACYAVASPNVRCSGERWYGRAGGSRGGRSDSSPVVSAAGVPAQSP